MPQAARYYARLQNKQPEETIPQLFGVFFLIYQASTIWGSIISSSGKILNMLKNSLHKLDSNCAVAKSSLRIRIRHKKHIFPYKRGDGKVWSELLFL